MSATTKVARPRRAPQKKIASPLDSLFLESASNASSATAPKVNRLARRIVAPQNRTFSVVRAIAMPTLCSGIWRIEPTCVRIAVSATREEPVARKKSQPNKAAT